MEKIQKEKESPYKKVIQSYINKLNSQILTVPTLYKILSAQVATNAKNVRSYISEHGTEEKDEEGKDIVKMPLEYARAFEKVNANMNNSFQALDNVGRNAVVAMVSMYDAYIGSLAKLIYADMPQLLNQSQKDFKLNNILSYKDFDELKDVVTEDEIESLLRKSHIEQLKWIENKLDMPVTEFKALPLFVELMERRNLFVHADGKVSRHYLEICESYGMELEEDVKLGKKLNAELDYVHKAFEILFQAGVMLGFVVWHKIRPSEGEQLIDNLSEVCYDLIKESYYDLSLIMIDFALDNKSFKKHILYVHRLVFLINKALNYHLKNKQKDCMAIAGNLDLSATEPVYHLAVAVLKENYDEALHYMAKIGNDPNMRSNYKEWPLFTKFREQESFKNKYKEIYEEEYMCLEVRKPKFEEIIAFAEKMTHKESSESDSSDKDKT